MTRCWFPIGEREGVPVLVRGTRQRPRIRQVIPRPCLSRGAKLDRYPRNRIPRRGARPAHTPVATSAASPGSTPLHGSAVGVFGARRIFDEGFGVEVDYERFAGGWKELAERGFVT